MDSKSHKSTLRFGWAETEITPHGPVAIAGQFHLRVSEGIESPLYTTALCIDSDSDYCVMASCDIVSISDEILTGVRQALSTEEGGPDPQKVILNATHTHTGPEIRSGRSGGGTMASGGHGVHVEMIPVEDTVRDIVEKIVSTILTAWHKRESGSFAFGQGTAVVGHNRRWVNSNGDSTMYGNTNTAEFQHIEGGADHTVGVIATYTRNKKLSGLIVNIPCPSQVSESAFEIGADYWHETRAELRKRFGSDIFILPQCAAAGDISPRRIFDTSPEARMRKLSGRSERDEIATRIADGVGEVLPWLEPTLQDNAIFKHSHNTLSLPLNLLREEDIAHCTSAIAEAEEKYNKELAVLEADPSLKSHPRWYTTVTSFKRRVNWNQGVLTRYEAQKENPQMQVEYHCIRLGDIAIITNPFEYYLDYAHIIKAQSPATQTFTIQLAGAGTYLPSPRSTKGGGYGSTPASNPVGPEGGGIMTQATLESLQELFQ